MEKYHGSNSGQKWRKDQNLVLSSTILGAKFKNKVKLLVEVITVLLKYGLNVIRPFKASAIVK